MSDEENQEINPDSTVLRQLDGYWQRVALLILWKCKGRVRITITEKEIAQFAKEFEPGNAVLLTQGQKDCLEFQVITEERARALAEYDRTQRGHA